MSDQGLAIILEGAAIFSCEIFFARGQGEEVGEGVLDEFLIASILEAPCELFDQATAFFDFSLKEGPAAFVGEVSALEVGLNIS